jgi:uncharacterized protein YajQ (UPF0234 family)
MRLTSGGDMKAASIHCGLDKRQEKDMPSFDIVSKTDMTSVDNALQGVVKEMQVRYDFKGSKSEISKEGEAIFIIADDELKRRQVEELLLTHLTRKGVDTAALEFGKTEQAGGNTVRQTVTVKQGVQRDVAQKIVKAIKSSKLKTQASIQGDEVRVTGKKRDDLQATMTMIKELDAGLPLQFENFRD